MNPTTCNVHTVQCLFISEHTRVTRVGIKPELFQENPLVKLDKLYRVPKDFMNFSPPTQPAQPTHL